jgi:hypothetical protein
MKYIIINAEAIQKRIEELERLYKNSEKPSIQGTLYNQLSIELKQILSQSTPLIPDIKDIQIWLSKQSYQQEYGEQEYMMYYDVDVPKIIQDYISNLKLDI